MDVDSNSAATAQDIALCDEQLERTLAQRIADLTGFQDRAYAERYAEEVRRITAIAIERAGDQDGFRIGDAYARGLHKLMAYKHEYEVARLHLDPAETARREAAYGPDAKVSVMLHPPLLRAMGMRRKIKLGGWISGPAFKALRAARRLRGTPLDPFGYAEVRKVERELIRESQRAVRVACEYLDPRTAGQVLELAGSPGLVRGYEEIKLANVERFRTRITELFSEMESVRTV